MGVFPSRRHHRDVAIAPRTFYLVIGKPSIRFTRERTLGPLIYDVEVDKDGDEQLVERAETLEMQSAVSSKQEFALNPSTPHSGGSRGLTLTFNLTQATAVKQLRVYAGVEVEYNPGDGIRISQGERSQTPYCVLDQHSATTERVSTTEQVFPQQLQAASFATDANFTIPGGRRLIAAPIAIVLTLDCEVAVDAGDNNDVAGAAEETEGNEGTRSTRENAAGAGANSSLREETQFRTKEVIQYTFLDLPTEAFSWDGSVPPPNHAGNSAEGGGEEAAALRRRPSNASTAAAKKPSALFKARVVKQLLQIGAEVYELEDVFDLGVAEEVGSGVDEADEDGDLCVVCLTNRKDTTILPCRHMCLCYDCAGQLRLNNNKCPICRSEIERVITL